MRPSSAILESVAGWPSPAFLLLVGGLLGPACANSGQTGSLATGGPSYVDAGPDSATGGAPPDGDVDAPVPGVPECRTDADCVHYLEQWTQPLATSVTLLGSACALDPNLDPLPVCQCTVHVVPTAPGGPFDTILYAGLREFPTGQGCSEYGRTGRCLYCASEFPGCHLESFATDCAGICQDLVGRVATVWQASYQATVRVARCSSSHCEQVFELDGRCFVGEVLPDSAGYDCSLGNQELLALGRSTQPTCPAPVHDCASAADCPGGLACNHGSCGSCAMNCSAPDGQPFTCEGDSACASGELCALGLCLPAGNIGCREAFQCADDQACVLSGVDLHATHGNAATRSFCVPRAPGP